MKYRLLMMGTVILVILSACGSPIQENMSRDVHALSAVNQEGEQVQLPSDLEGSYWIVDFIFTNCETVCPPMTGNMARLQQLLKQEKLSIPLMSFTVDPENDSPSKLKEFSEPYQPDYDQWSFLTGYTFKEIKEFSIKSFQSPLKQLEDTDQFAHGTSFYLINPEGEVIKSYSGTKADSMNKIIEDIKALKE
ncbi:SCO family protein [Halobacillus locisalis]|uniref:SCO family protein n=2 Tax=Halobacillus locisalis TaxID=220753 RepID=A0A838CRW7_9BACI|nr:SCO family protein [Halobacillus locisalis]